MILLAGLAVLGIVILVHELGHLLAAKVLGIRILTFSVGFGPRLATLKLGETSYCISLIPFGGYVRPLAVVDSTQKEHANDVDAAVCPSISMRSQRRKSLDLQALSASTLRFLLPPEPRATELGDPKRFLHSSQNLLKRGFAAQAFFYSAGCLANLVLALALLYGALPAVMTIETFNTPAHVKAIVPDRSLAQIGLQQGDKIIKVNDWSVSTWRQFADSMYWAARAWEKWHLDGQLGSSVRLDGVSLPVPRSNQLTVLRDDREIILPFEPVREATQAAPVKRYLSELGVVALGRERSLTWSEAFKLGNEVALGMWERMFGIKSQRNPTGSADLVKFQLRSPVSAVIDVGYEASLDLRSFLAFTVALSFFAVLLNLIPFPGLDGGHLLIAFVELCRRQSLSVELRMQVHRIGLASFSVNKSFEPMK